MPITEEDLKFRMGYHKATEDTIPLHRELRNAFIELGKVALEHTDPGREQSLAITELQNSLMWANAAVAMNAPIALDQ